MPALPSPQRAGLPAAWLSPEAGVEFLLRTALSVFVQAPATGMPFTDDSIVPVDDWRFVECDDATRVLPRGASSGTSATVRTVLAWVGPLRRTPPRAPPIPHLA